MINKSNGPEDEVVFDIFGFGLGEGLYALYPHELEELRKEIDVVLWENKMESYKASLRKKGVTID